jgi:hypothetical protein
MMVKLGSDQKKIEEAATISADRKEAVFFRHSTKKDS